MKWDLPGEIALNFSQSSHPLLFWEYPKALCQDSDKLLFKLLPVGLPGHQGEAVSLGLFTVRIILMKHLFKFFATFKIGLSYWGIKVHYIIFI